MIRVGQKLQDTRINKSLTLEEIAKATKIRPSFLVSIENGEYDKLPSPAYAAGFVRNYASFLGLSEKEILPLYRREFAEKRQYKVLPDMWSIHNTNAFTRLQIGRSFIILAFILLGLFGYLGFQYRAMIVSPMLILDSPKQNSAVSGDFTVSGRTDPSVTVFVNNDVVSLNANGEFNKKLTLFSGKNLITIRAKNRFGKETVLQRNVIVKN